MGATGTSDNHFKYLGIHGLWDNGDGTLFARARHFDPLLGRFLSRDPLRGTDTGTQTINRYIYALNNPLSLVDVTGLSARDTNSLHLSPNWQSTPGLAPLQVDQRIYGSGFIHFALDVCGLGFDPCDPVNAGLYEYEGNHGDAALSVASALPVVGIAGTVGKWGKRVKAAISEEKEIKILVRYGTDTLEKLVTSAEKAEKAGFPHGVSVKSVEEVANKVRSGLSSEVEEFFDIIKTGVKPDHYTVVLPKPVTEEVVQVFNSLFK